MKVKEIMKTKVITINKNATIKECGDLLEKYNINGAVVVNNENQVVGIITRTDIFKAILPRFPEIFEGESYLTDFEAIEERVHKINKLKIEELMTTPIIAVNPETPLIKAGSIMILRRIKQMPVIKDDRLLGIITLTDICKYLIAKAGKKSK